MKKTDDETLIQALRLLARDIISEDGVARSVIMEAADRIEEKIAKPTCPICKQEMQKQNYQGYYDEFSYWSCACEHFDDVEPWFGAYA